MNITTQVSISPSMLSNLLVDALEGGSSHWCYRILLTKEPPGLTERPWYADPKLFEAGTEFEMQVSHDKTTSEDTGRKTLTLASFEKGLQLLAYNYPTHFADIMQDQTDACTADAVLQMACFEEIVFG